MLVKAENAEISAKKKHVGEDLTSVRRWVAFKSTAKSEVLKQKSKEKFNKIKNKKTLTHKDQCT